MRAIGDVLQITKKDLLEFMRDRLRLVTFAIMPIFMMVMVGFIFPSQNTLKNIPIGIANQNGDSGGKLVEVIGNMANGGDKIFKVSSYNNIDEIKEGIKQQKIGGGLVIPSDFSEKISQNQQANVTIIQDQSNPQISALTTQVLTKVIEGFGQQIGAQKVSQILISKLPVKTTPQPDQGLAFVSPIKTSMEGIIPGDTNYFEFVAPGIMAMVVMTAVLTGLAASVSREKEQGTLDGILISPISRLSIILGKAFSQSIRGLIQGMIVLALAILLFGVKMRLTFCGRSHCLE